MYKTYLIYTIDNGLYYKIDKQENLDCYDLFPNELLLTHNFSSLFYIYTKIYTYLAKYAFITFTYRI